MKYRKKPVVVEAVQWTGENLEEVRKFVRKKGKSVLYDNDNECLWVHTCEGWTIARPHDWIVYDYGVRIIPLQFFFNTYEQSEPYVKLSIKDAKALDGLIAEIRPLNHFGKELVRADEVFQKAIQTALRSDKTS